MKVHILIYNYDQSIVKVFKSKNEARKFMSFNGLKTKFKPDNDYYVLETREVY